MYYFESTLSPNIVWVNLDRVNLGPGSCTRAVAVEGDFSVIGNIDNQLPPAKPIAFRSPTPPDAPQVLPRLLRKPKP